MRRAVGSLPAGMRRALTAGLCAALLAVTLAACGPRDPDTSPPQIASESVEWAGLRYTVELRPSPDDRIRAAAEVRNVSGRHLTAEIPFCLLQLRIYRGGTLVWDQAEARACVGVRDARLAPEESERQEATVMAREILGDEWPDGLYDVRAHLPRGRGLRVPRAEMEFRLGQVRLEREAETEEEEAEDTPEEDLHPPDHGPP